MKVLKGLGYIFYLYGWGEAKEARDREKGENAMYVCGLEGSPTKEEYFRLKSIIDSNREEAINEKKYPVIVFREDKEQEL